MTNISWEAFHVCPNCGADDFPFNHSECKIIGINRTKHVCRYCNHIWFTS